MAHYLAPNDRPTIAFFTAEIEGEYSNTLCQGALDCAEANDVNLIMFPGKAINSPYSFQHQYNVIYDLVSPDNVDALIIPLSIFHAFPSQEPVWEFCRRFSPLPLVTINIKIPGATGIVIDNEKGLHDLLNHLIRVHGRRTIAFIKGTKNNIDAEGRYEVYCRVLRENNLPLNPQLVCPGDFTVNAVPGALQLLLDERQIGFDTLVAANDEMALAALALLQKRGIRVPDDVAVAGFDNVAGARLSTPPLTTIRQPIYEMGRSSVEHALALLRGEPVSTVTLPTSMVLRASCGCRNVVADDAVPVVPTATGTTRPVPITTTDSDDSAALQRALIGALSKVFEDHLHAKETIPLETSSIVRCLDEASNGAPYSEYDLYLLHETFTVLRRDFFSRQFSVQEAGRIGDLFDQARVIAFNLVQTKEVQRWSEHDLTFRNLRGVLYAMFPFVDSRQQAIAAAAQPLKTLGIRSCQVYLYDEEIFHPDYQKWSTPDMASLVMAYSDEQPEPVLRERNQIATRSILRSCHLPGQRRYSLIVNPLFFLNYQMGLIVCELNLVDRLMYESLFIEMGCVLKFSHLISIKNRFENQLRDALHELETHNQHLSDVSQTDDLTGLCNRRGFLKTAGAAYSAALSRSAAGHLFYADIDGMKSINDSHGREEGDNAIKAAAMILKKTFRSSDIIARLGGDEFTIFTTDTTPEAVEAISRRLTRLTDEFNRQSEHQFRISIRFGVIAFPCDNINSFESLLDKADRSRYELIHQRDTPHE